MRHGVSFQRSNVRGLQRIFPSHNQGTENVQLRFQQSMQNRKRKPPPMSRLSTRKMSQNRDEKRVYHDRCRNRSKGMFKFLHMKVFALFKSIKVINEKYFLYTTNILIFSGLAIYWNEIRIAFSTGKKAIVVVAFFI